METRRGLRWRLPQSEDKDAGAREKARPLLRQERQSTKPLPLMSLQLYDVIRVNRPNKAYHNRIGRMVELPSSPPGFGWVAFLKEDETIPPAQAHCHTSKVDKKLLPLSQLEKVQQ